VQLNFIPQIGKNNAGKTNMLEGNPGGRTGKAIDSSVAICGTSLDTGDINFRRIHRPRTIELWSAAARRT
jgi:hypothetical protein